jgi:hypothetical protein
MSRGLSTGLFCATTDSPAITASKKSRFFFMGMDFNLTYKKRSKVPTNISNYLFFSRFQGKKLTPVTGIRKKKRPTPERFFCIN